VRNMGSKIVRGLPSSPGKYAGVPSIRHILSSVVQIYSMTTSLYIHISPCFVIPEQLKSLAPYTLVIRNPYYAGESRFKVYRQEAHDREAKRGFLLDIRKRKN